MLGCGAQPGRPSQSQVVRMISRFKLQAREQRQRSRTIPACEAARELRHTLNDIGGNAQQLALPEKRMIDVGRGERNPAERARIGERAWRSARPKDRASWGSTGHVLPSYSFWDQAVTRI